MIETNNNDKPLVAIFGRTNVGKSTLFNCLTEKKQALVSNISGTTRDSNLGLVEWNNKSFNIVDTAGFLDYKLLEKENKDEGIDEKIQEQARRYLDKSDLIIFLVDAKTGMLPEDKELAKTINKIDKYKNKTILVSNKVDSLRIAPETAEFNKLGLGEPFLISAVSGLATGDLLDLIVKKIKFKKIIKKDKGLKNYNIANEIKVALVGKPNAGKSSLLNSILGYERVIVSPIPHTTREAQDTEVIYKDNSIRLIDTAGISRQGRKGKGLQKFGIENSIGVLKKSDIALLVLDLSNPITHQDLKIIDEIVSKRVSLIIIANKWDKIENRNTKEWTEYLRDKLPFLSFAPIQFLSAKTGEKVNKIMDLVLQISEERKIFLSESQTEKFLKHIVKIHKPAKGKGTKAPHIYEFKQIKNDPPLFNVRIGPNDDLHFSYVRFMENRLRERHSFLGTPINIKIVKATKSHTTFNIKK
jgi:GTP-binding protein